MRDAFAETITRLAAEDSRVVLLSGDIGNRMFDKFKQRFPERFYNCGVAEANMVSMAAGMAAAGLRPFVYTIVPFLVYRAYEQIRVDACYHNVPVTLVGTGAGLSYASLGATHHSLEDIAVLRALPNMKVVCPGDPLEVKLAVAAVLAETGPVYIRLGKKGEPAIHQERPDFAIGRALVVRPGADIAMLCAGGIVTEALRAAELLAAAGIAAEVVSFHTVKPLDQDYLRKAFSAFRLVASIEEHGRAGGLGGAIAEWLAPRPSQTAGFIAFGTGDAFLHGGGTEKHARDAASISAEKLHLRLRQVLENTDGAGQK